MTTQSSLSRIRGRLDPRKARETARPGRRQAREREKGRRSVISAVFTDYYVADNVIIHIHAMPRHSAFGRSAPRIAIYSMQILPHRFSEMRLRAWPVSVYRQSYTKEPRVALLFTRTRRPSREC